jgi:hypothetical protein
MEYLKQAMLRNASSAQQEIVERATSEGRAINQTGGQSITEKMGELGGASTSPDPQLLQKGGRATREYDPMGDWGGSNPVDLKFKNDIRVGKGKDSTVLTVSDTTSSTYQRGTHHGIGLTEINAPVKYEKGNNKPLRKKIMAEQNIRINRYNDILSILKGLEYGTNKKGKTISGQDLGLVELRRKLATEHLGGRKHAYDNSEALLEESKLDRNMSVVRKKITDTLTNESAAQLNKALEHVLHAIGNFAGGEMWASMMNLDVIYPQNQPGFATLILNYGWTAENTFKKLKLSEVQVVEDSVVHWIYRHRDESNKHLTFTNMTDMANESMAVEGYADLSATGTLVAAVGSSARIHQTAHMAMPIEGELAGVIDDISTKVILRVAGGLEKELSGNLIKEATRYSKQMRNPTKMGRIPEWVDAFASSFLTDPATGQTADDYVEQAGQDPFSYLWATPYISTIYPRLGGAEQHT